MGITVVNQFDERDHCMVLACSANHTEAIVPSVVWKKKL